MSEPVLIKHLHAEYAQLQCQPSSSLTQDQTRSLVFFSAEVAALDDQGVADGIAGVESHEAVSNDVTSWIRQLFALERFVHREGRLPRENRRLPMGAISAEEKRCTYIVRAQRRAFMAGRLCSYQVRRLQCIPAFTFQPRADAWHAKYAAYATFTASHGEAPKLSSIDTSERALAGWAAKTRMAYRAGTLAPSRIEAMNALAIWAWGSGSRPR
ncbi:helicase associated domain-containing protein [Cryobacterium sp. AP23]